MADFEIAVLSPARAAAEEVLVAAGKAGALAVVDDCSVQDALGLTKCCARPLRVFWRPVWYQDEPTLPGACGVRFGEHWNTYRSDPAFRGI